jgi:hypothetical protein
MRSPFTVTTSGIHKSATGFRVGHVSLLVTGGEPSGDVYMSWFPTAHGSISSTARVGQTYSQDVALEKSDPLSPLSVGSPSKTLDETAIKAWWKAFKSSPPKWVLTSTNCAQLVVEALRAGGAEKYLVADQSTAGKLLGLPPWESWSVVWRPWNVDGFVASINRGLSAR